MGIDRWSDHIVVNILEAESVRVLNPPLHHIPLCFVVLNEILITKLHKNGKIITSIVVDLHPTVWKDGSQSKELLELYNW